MPLKNVKLDHAWASSLRKEAILLVRIAENVTGLT